METEPYYDENGLPWGAALVPEWWKEVTPHHVMDYDEIDRQRRQDASRLNMLRSNSPAHISAEDGALLLADTSAGPYSLPGFQTSDGIADASFVGPGDQKWYITNDGYFYSLADPEVRYTPAQMVESGHLPPGMDSYFVKGWDRARALSSPVDTSMYARSEEIGWEKPDWMKKKLRSTDQGIAMRHGLRDFEEHSRGLSDDENPPVSSPSPQTFRAANKSPARGRPIPEDSGSKSPVPAWQLKRQQILKEKTEAQNPDQHEQALADVQKLVQAQKSSEEQIAMAPPKVGEVRDQPNETPAAEETLTMENKEAPAVESDAAVAEVPEQVDNGAAAVAVAATATAAVTVPAWKKKTADESTAVPEERGRSRSPAVPEWKRKQEEMARSRTNSPAPAWMKKQEDDGNNKTEEASVPAWKKKTDDTDERESPAVPAWKKKQEDKSPSIPVLKKKAEEDTTAPPVPAWKKTQEANTPATPTEFSSVPAWKKRMQETAAPTESTGDFHNWVPGVASSPSPQQSLIRPSVVAEDQDDEWEIDVDNPCPSKDTTDLEEIDVDNYIPRAAGSTSVPAWKKQQPGASSPAPAESAAPNPAASVPAWKKKQQEASASTPTESSRVPAWKVKQQATAATAESAASTPTGSSPVPAWKNKQQATAATAESTASTPPELSPVPAWKNKQQATATTAESAASTPPESSPVPAWKSKQQMTSATAESNSTGSAWKKKEAEQTTTTPPWKKPQPHRDGRSLSPQPEPAWKRKQQEALAAKETEAAKAKEDYEEEVAEDEEFEEEVVEESEVSDSEVEDQAGKLVSQGLVLKLMALPTDASRAKELRNAIAATPENNHKVMVTPSELLLAIAHHAQSWKGQADSRDKINTLRQVAIIARLVIMKLYGSNSSELKQFEDGLRPAFS